MVDVSSAGDTSARVGVRIDGLSASVYLRDEGPRDGPVLVLLHGFSGSLSWFDAAVPLLTDTFRVVRLDLLGHGRTGGPAADAPVQARVAEAVLERLDLSGVTAVGHSFGADVAVELAEKSDRVDRLVIITQAPDYHDANLPRGNRIMTVPVLAHVLHRLGRALLAVIAAVRLGVRSRTSDRELVLRARHDFGALNTDMFRVILVDRRIRMVGRPLDEQVRAAGKPALAILGGRDHFYGARSAGRYEAAGARVEILPDAGHSPLIEDPPGAVALIREFAGAPVVG